MEKKHHSIQALILDMDGVLWQGDQPIGDLPAIFTRIQRKGFAVCLATNNATRSVTDYVERLASFGVELEPRQIVNSAMAAAYYLKSLHAGGGPVYVVGEAGLKETLASHGFYEAEQDVIAVVAGMDRMITYAKLGAAAKLIRGGALFLGTNPDNTYPTPEGLMPGAGSILAALQAASGSSPVIAGKPQPEMYKIALESMRVQPTEALVVGDRLETDIEGAQAIGCQTALVLSGVTTRVMAESWQPRPDFVAEDLSSLVDEL
jgi:4-nitrophenyl phosphatase